MATEVFKYCSRQPLLGLLFGALCMNRLIGHGNTNSKPCFLQSGDHEHKLWTLIVDLLFPAILYISRERSKMFFISRPMRQEKLCRKREAKGGRQRGWWGKKKGRKRRRKRHNSTKGWVFSPSALWKSPSLHGCETMIAFNSCDSSIASWHLKIHPRLQYRPKMKLPFFRMFSLPLLYNQQMKT